MLTDREILQTRLVAAQEAYHRLQTGSLRETIDHNGTRIQYTRTDADKLKGYINELLGDLAENNGPPRRRRIIASQYIT